MSLIVSYYGGLHPTTLKGLPCSFGRSLTLTPSLTEQASSDVGAFRRREVKKAYKRTAKIPSRGVWGYNKHYASASGAIRLAFGLESLGKSQDWLSGFDEGFEHTGHLNNFGAGQPKLETVAVLAAASSMNKEFTEGFEAGLKVADFVFHYWPDSPDIHSKPEK